MTSEPPVQLTYLGKSTPDPRPEVLFRSRQGRF
jgi:hypothetical protein